VGGEGQLDLAEYVVRISQNLFVQEAQDSPAAPPKKGVTFQIMAIFGAVLAAVGFDDEARFDRGKVRDVGRDGVLATEVPTGEVRVLENLPQRVLRPRLIAAEVAGSVAVEFGNVWHRVC